MLISNQGLSIIGEFLDLDFSENKDLICFAIDSISVLFNYSPDNQPLFPHDDIALTISRLGIIEKLTRVLPQLINSIETITDFKEHSSAERYLEKTFDIL
jgi:regulator of sigma D